METFNCETKENLTTIGTFVEPHENRKKTLNEDSVEVITIKSYLFSNKI
ncbi:hypothetical protein [Streptobacillus moniliformis]|nr:hypothetical protein [Streptobacillus moniliformis]